MKKKFGLLLLASFAVFSLTSCASILYYFIGGDSSSSSYNSGESTPTSSNSEGTSQNTSSSSGDYSSSSQSSQSSGSSQHSQSSEDSQSSQQSQSSSTPDTPVIEAKKASYNYMDYIENNVYPLSSTPCVGEAKILVIPVWFSDSSNFISPNAKRRNVKSDIETAYFGTNEETGWRSVKTYYEEESFGALTLTGKVSDWYECSNSCSYYKQDNDTSRTTQLIKDATNWYFNNNPSDSRRYHDCDHDGFLDGVMVIYAAPDFQSWRKTSGYDNLWAYCYWAQDYSVQNPNNPGLNAFFWASYDFMYGSNKATTRAGSSYAGGDTTYCTIDAHTYIHEMGHMFGLDDYYDYSENRYSPAGSFSMQDANVGSHDAFSSYALGWGKAYIPTQSMTINLKPFTTSGEMILLSPSFNSYNSPFDEYLLIEYYTPTGLNQFDTQHGYQGGAYPTGSTQSGIRLWHVDARLAYTRDGNFSASKLTTNPKISNNYVTMAMSNSFDDGDEATEGYLSVLGSSYYNYNMLQLIRNSKTETYRSKNDFSSSSLFKAGATFTMSDYSRQFVNSGKLNSNVDLGFSFTVNSLNSNQATITINKL